MKYLWVHFSSRPPHPGRSLRPYSLGIIVLGLFFPWALAGALQCFLWAFLCVSSGRFCVSPRLSWVLGLGLYQYQLRVQTKNMQCHLKGLRPPMIRYNLQIKKY